MPDARPRHRALPARRAALLGLALCALLVAWLAVRDDGATPRADPSVAPPTASDARASPPEPALAGASEEPRTVALAPEEPTAPPAPPSTAVPATEAWLDVQIVSTDTREPLAGVRVAPSPADGSGPREVEDVDAAEGDALRHPRTGPDGRARVVLAPATAYRLGVWSEATRAQSRSLEVAPLAAGERRELVIELGTAYSVAFHGRVVARQDRAPIAGARVRVGDLRTALERVARREAPALEATTDADGRFALSGPSWTTLQGTIEAVGFGPRTFGLVPGHEARERERTFELDRSAALVVRVLGARREPVADARVLLVTRPWLLSDDASVLSSVAAPDPSWSARTEADGRATLEGLPPSAALELEVRAGAGARTPRRSLSLEPGERRELEIVLGSGATLRGRLVDEHGAPFPGRSVWLTKPFGPGMLRVQSYPAPHAKGRTDERGAFVFGDVPAGEWLVGPPDEPWRPGERPVSEVLVPRGELVRVEAGVDPPELVLRAQRGLSIAGSVAGPGGPASGALVEARGESGAFAFSTSDAQGRFELGPLAEGEYELSADPGPLQKGLAFGESVRARAGDAGVALTLAAGGAIALEVLDGGRPSGHVALRLVHGEGCALGGGIEVGEAKDGRHVFERLHACTYAIAATAADPPRFALVRELRLGEGERREDVVLELAPAARLRVRSARTEGFVAAAVRHEGVLAAGGEGVDPGATKTFVVPAGQSTLVVWEPPAPTPAESPIELAPGEVREVVVGARR